MNINHAPLYSNISDLRKSPSRIIQQADQEITAIFNHGDLVSYMVPPKVLDELLEMKADKASLSRIQDMDLSKAVDVNIDEL